MTIELTIDNLDSLPDGGPTRFRAERRGFEIGREQHLDWTLPDPGRYISGRHCEVRHENDGYWLHDTSTNGVFLNGSSQRLKSPYRLEDGDRLTIGHYIINVSIGGQALPDNSATDAARSALPLPPGGDIWGAVEPAPPPVDRKEFLPPASSRREADFSQHFLEFPDAVNDALKSTPAGGEIWPASAAPIVNVAPSEPLPPTPLASPPFFPDDAAGLDPSAPPRVPAFDALAARPLPAPGERPRPSPSLPQPPVQPSYEAPPAAAPQAASGFLAAFAAGAGVSPEALKARNPDELAFEIGEFVRLSAEHLTQLLKARAAAKTMTKSASRTMISAADNNPLKFVPSVPEAIEMMLTRKRPGYLDAKRSLEEAFGDLKRHEIATYAAMQKALAKLLDELAPDAIEKKVGGSAFAPKKGRAWDLYVSKWEERSSGENGMLDAFLAHFAEAYDEASKKKGP